MPVSELRDVEVAGVRRVSLATATVSLHGDLKLNVVLDGRIETYVAKATVAAMLASEIVTALGHSALYDAGLERAAQVVSSATTEDISADPRDDLERLALEIRECKIGRTR